MRSGDVHRQESAAVVICQRSGIGTRVGCDSRPAPGLAGCEPLPAIVERLEAMRRLPAPA